MEHARHLVCPVLVGRDDLLDLADRRIVEVAGGAGRFLLLAGEAGVGKTRLLGAIERRATAAGFSTVRGGAYPSDLQVAGAILIDLARAMQRRPLLQDAGTRLERRLGGPRAGDATDPSHRRRLLVLDVAELLAEIGSDEPAVLSFEDIHWSDDLTLEVLEALARRVPETRLLVIASFRSDELFPRAPMRDWRSRIVGRREAEEIRVARLGPADTAAMATLLIGQGLPTARDVVDAIHDRTDGIPLHVEELVGMLDVSAGLDADRVRDADVPETVEDAILARLDLRTPEAATVARAGAVIGRSFDLEMLAGVTGLDPADLSAPLAELADHFILLPTHTPGRFGFRHALICDAIYARIPSPDRRALHGRTADTARTRPQVGTRAFLALHLERAERPSEAYDVAIAAADEAAGLSSHTEARDLYACALRTMPADMDPAERARVLEAFASSAAATDDNAAAAEAFMGARAAYVEAGRTLAAAAVVGPYVATRHLLGDDLESRVALLRSALADIDAPAGSPGPSIDPATDDVRARLLAALATAYMLDRRLEPAFQHGLESRDLAVRVGARDTEIDATTTLGVCEVFGGRMAGGWSRLEACVADAAAAGLEAAGTRAYRMVGSCASVLVEYERAERWLRAGVEEADRLQLWNHRHYMAAHLAHVEWATGRWVEADDRARRVLTDGRGGITTRVTALHVIGFVALGRGQLDAARASLVEARDAGIHMHELQRLSPALWGLAEVALARRDANAAIESVEAGAAASLEVGDAAYLAPLLVTGVRAYLAAGDPHRAHRWLELTAPVVEARAIPGTVPALAHARGLVELAEGSTGKARASLNDAITGWRERGRVWEGTWAMVDMARLQARTNQRTDARRVAGIARDRAIDLDAPAIVAAASEVLRIGGRGDEPEPWAPLTSREFDVARCITQGLTNAQIAEDLGITRKTVASHVEHILAKLGVGRRAEIAAWTAARPVLHSRPHGRDREE